MAESRRGGGWDTATGDEGHPARGCRLAPRLRRGRLLLANIYLHYVYDLLADQWRQRHACGAMIVVRYADDTVVGFEHQADAERFLADLRIRMAEFDLELHPDKTRLVEFGRHAGSD